MAKYSVGLDIGISSVGWAIIDIETKQIVNLGSRIFPSGNAAGNQERRSFRGTRRLIRRRKNRLTDLKKLLGETFFSDLKKLIQMVMNIMISISKLTLILMNYELKE